MTKIIGLTGGIGSGKSSVAKMFISRGIPVYFADDEAKKILNLPETISEIVEKFGEELLSENQIDRQKLAAIVFNNPAKLNQLNKIIHPKVKKHFDNWVKEHESSPFVLKEAAILFESGSYEYCDKIISVVAPLEIRIERVIKRDSTTRKLVLQRINNQWTDVQRIEKSNFVIENISFDTTEKQVEEILKILNKSQ